MFVGYPFRQKGWRLYDLETNKYFVSKDVVFCEEQFPYADNISQNCVPTSKPIQGFECIVEGDDNHKKGGTSEPVSIIEGDEDETNEVREGNIVVEAKSVTGDATEPHNIELALGRGLRSKQVSS